MKNKILAVVLAAVLLLTAVFSVGCTAQRDNGKLNIVCTVFPEYDWVRAIVGDAEGVSVSLLLSNGTDVHSYQPSAADIVTVTQSDLFIYIGGESDAWVDEILRNNPRRERTDLKLMQILDGKTHLEETPNGAEPEAEEEAVADEHIWLSFDNAAAVCQAICDTLCEADAKNAALYRQNCEAYADALTELKARYADTVSHAARKVLLFGDRFPFRYLTEEFGLDYYAAFAGCSSETDAAFDTVIRLAQAVDQHKLPVILTTESSDGAIARAIAENAGHSVQISALDSMQSVTAAQIADGYTFLSCMEDNLSVLTHALCD